MSARLSSPSEYLGRVVMICIVEIKRATPEGVAQFYHALGLYENLSELAPSKNPRTSGQGRQRPVDLQIHRLGRRGVVGDADVLAVGRPGVARVVDLGRGAKVAQRTRINELIGVVRLVAHVISNFSSLEGFWVSYRAQWPGPYLSSATDIPLEFFYWAAHATYADFLRMDGQVDKAMAEEGAAQTYLVLEMDKAEHQRNNNAVLRRISTYVSRSAR